MAICITWGWGWVRGRGNGLVGSVIRMGIGLDYSCRLIGLSVNSVLVVVVVDVVIVVIVVIVVVIVASPYVVAPYGHIAKRPILDYHLSAPTTISTD